MLHHLRHFPTSLLLNAVSLVSLVHLDVLGSGHLGVVESGLRQNALTAVSAVLPQLVKHLVLRLSEVVHCIPLVNVCQLYALSFVTLQTLRFNHFCIHDIGPSGVLLLFESEALEELSDWRLSV